MNGLRGMFDLWDSASRTVSMCHANTDEAAKDFEAQNNNEEDTKNRNGCLKNSDLLNKSSIEQENGETMVDMEIPLLYSRSTEPMDLSSRNIYPTSDKDHGIIVDPNPVRVTEFTCRVCKEVFKQQYWLSVHEKIHIRDKPQECDVCGKRFRDVVGLKVHQQVHLGLKPYCCKQCGESFARHGQFIRHLETCGKDIPLQLTKKTSDATRKENSPKKSDSTKKTPNKKHACLYCIKKFSSQGGLKIHMSQKHRDVCDTCSQRFADAADLAAHQDACGKLYSCDPCKENFTNFQALKEHRERKHKTRKGIYVRKPLSYNS